MAKVSQILILDPPQELRFKGPFTEVVTAELKLVNPSKKRIGFKVKTTAPKQYCVRPNNGVVEPNSVVTVAVMLQPFNYDPGEKNRHKFLVQAMVLPDQAVDNLDALWKDIPLDQLMESKLKCVFDVSAELLQNVGPQRVNGTSVAKSPVSSKIKNDHQSEDTVKNELGNLRDDNAKLKDDGLRQRRGDDNSSSRSVNVSSSSPSFKSLPFLQDQQLNPMLLAALGAVVLLALVLGVVVGKFVL